MSSTESSLSGASSWSSEAYRNQTEMSLTFVVVSVLAMTSGVEAVISGNYNCTTYNGTAFVYTPSAVICSNSLSDSSCQVLYAAPNTLYPAAGNDAERAYACYTTATATPASSVNDMVKAAFTNCPKTCGFCCMTSAYNCANVAYPRLTCSSITAAQCQSSVWRTIIAQDCPASCGFCNDGGCVDGVIDCANDVSISPAHLTEPTQAPPALHGPLMDSAPTPSTLWLNVKHIALPLANSARDVIWENFYELCPNDLARFFAAATGHASGT
ncbi:unnamed protein product [Caenorhabditis brenneri]